MYGEHFVFSALMTVLLLGSFLVVSLVMLWAPSRPFPQDKETKREEPEDAQSSAG